MFTLEQFDIVENKLFNTANDDSKSAKHSKK